MSISGGVVAMATGESLPAGRWTLAAALVLSSLFPAEAQNVPGRIEVTVGPRFPELQPLFPHIGLAVLQDIKDLENRPEGDLEEWARGLRARYGDPHVRRPVARWLSDEIAGRSRPQLSEDELEVRTGRVQERLIRLAITGRVTKQEFDTFVRRLHGD